MQANNFCAFSLSINFKISINGVFFKHPKMSSSLPVIDFGRELISCLPSSKCFIKSCILSWFRKSTLHFKPWRNFLLSSWEVNFSEILEDSLYHDFGPNWTCPYLNVLAAWIDERLARAAGLFFNFLNTASLLITSLLRLDLVKESSLLELSESESSRSISTLPRSTPAFWTNVLSRFVYVPSVGDGTGKLFPNRSSSPDLVFLRDLISLILDSTGLRGRDCLSDRSRSWRPIDSLLRRLLLKRVSLPIFLSSFSSHNLHIWQICLIDAIGMTLRTNDGVPPSTADNAQRLSDDIFHLNISAIFDGQV